MDAVFVWAWLGAARLTRLLVADDVAIPVHEAVERRRRDAQAPLALPGEDTPARRAALRSARRWRWLGAMISCLWCVGLWIFLAMTGGAGLVAWLAPDTWQVLGGPWWWTLPNAALATHWVFALLSSHVDPAARKAPPG